MDPNANLAEQRAIIAELCDAPEGTDHTARLERLVELIVALDVWLTDGGFLPSDWRGPKSPAITGDDLRGIRFTLTPTSSKG